MKNGELLAKRDGELDVDYVAGVPDSGIAHALGYAKPLESSLFETFNKIHTYMAEKFHAAESESEKTHCQDEAGPCIPDNKG